MKTISGILLSLLMAAGGALAIPAPDTLWTRTYGMSGEQRCWAAAQTSDGGNVLVGSSNGDWFILRIGTAGDTMWSRTINLGGDDRAEAVIQGNDGDFYVGGTSYSSMIRFARHRASDGDTVWTHRYLGGTEVCRTLVQLPDGGFALGGVAGGAGDQFVLLRTNANGDSLWCRKYGETYAEDCNAVCALEDGGFALAGMKQFEGGNRDFWLVRTNASGDSLWSRQYGGAGIDICSDMVQTPDKGFALTGWAVTSPNGDFNYWLVKTDSSGNMQWNRSYGGLTDDYCTSLERLPDNGFFLSGYTSTGGINGNDIWVVRTATNGDCLWTRQFASPGWEESRAAGLNSDGGFWVSGTDSGGTMDFWLAKIAKDFTYLCGNPPDTLSVANSPYYVTCDLLVPAGDTLVIEPGVQLLFTGHYKFKVLGNLQAVGTEDDSIVFTRAFPTEESKWWGIQFQNAEQTSRLSYCVLEYGKADGPEPFFHGGAINIWNSEVEVRHCAIRWNEAAYSGGGAAVAYAAANFAYTDFIGNVSHSPTNGGGGLAVWWSDPHQVSNCTFWDNSASTNGGAISLHGGAGITLTNCVIYDNSAGGTGAALYQTGGDGAVNIKNSVVYMNDGGSGIAPVCNITYSDIQGGYDGIGNIDANPMFVNAADGDFRLLNNSPCIDAGDPAMFDPDCTPSDIGAYYYFHLAQPEELIVQQDGRDMVLHWTVVDSTECGFASPIQSYVIYYEQNFGERWDFLTAVTDTMYRHENVVMFAPSMYYEVVATDIELALIRRVAQPGMSREEFMAAAEREMKNEK